jgi:hypothetical protein
MASWRVEVVHAGAQRSAGAKAVALLVWTGAGRTGNSWQAGGRDTCMQGVKFSRRKESISSGRSAFMSMEQGQQIIKKNACRVRVFTRKASGSSGMSGFMSMKQGQQINLLGFD